MDCDLMPLNGKRNVISDTFTLYRYITLTMQLCFQSSFPSTDNTAIKIPLLQHGHKK